VQLPFRDPKWQCRGGPVVTKEWHRLGNANNNETAVSHQLVKQFTVVVSTPQATCVGENVNPAYRRGTG